MVINLLGAITKSNYTWPFLLDEFPGGVLAGESAVFNFAVYGSGSDQQDPLGSSHYFNITRPAQSTSYGSSSSSKSGPSLSKGAIAGISVGALTLAILLAGSLLLFLRKRRRQHGQKEIEHGKNEEFIAESEPHSGKEAHTPHEIDGEAKLELEGDNEMRAELCGVDQYPAELHGDCTIVSPCSESSYSTASQISTPGWHHQDSR